MADCGGVGADGAGGMSGGRSGSADGECGKQRSGWWWVRQGRRMRAARLGGQARLTGGRARAAAASRGSAEPRHSSPTQTLARSLSLKQPPPTSVVPYFVLICPHLTARAHNHGRSNPIALLGCSWLALRVSVRARDCQGAPRRAVEGRIRTVRTALPRWPAPSITQPVLKETSPQTGSGATPAANRGRL